MYQDIWLARATDAASLAQGQDGGVVSALLIWGLANGEIDGACTSKLSDERAWDAEPTVVTDAQGVLDTAGSRYTYSANPLALIKAAELGLSKVALVGMSCQASVTGSMEARRVNKWRKKIAWTFGLLCSKSFTYDGLMVEIAQNELGLDLDHLVRVNVKGKLLFYTDTGDELTYSLKAAPPSTRGPGACTARTSPPSTPTSRSAASASPRAGRSRSSAPSVASTSGTGRSPTGSSRRRPASEDPEGRGADVQARGPLPRTLARAERSRRPTLGRACCPTPPRAERALERGPPGHDRMVDGRRTHLRGAAR